MSRQISRLKWGDVERLSHGGQIQLFGKGSKSRVVRVSGDTMDLFESLGRGAPSDHLQRAKGRNTSDAPSNRVFNEEVGQTHDLELHPHRLRHNHATHAVRRGVDVFTLQSTLGHASSATTGHYVAANPEDSSSLRLG